jgi:hypothetical protein
MKLCLKVAGGRTQDRQLNRNSLFSVSLRVSGSRGFGWGVGYLGYIHGGAFPDPDFFGDIPGDPE